MPTVDDFLCLFFGPCNAAKQAVRDFWTRRHLRVVNSVDDVMIATINSWHMVQTIANAQLIVYPDAGYGAQFQYPERLRHHAVQLLNE